MNHDFLNKFVCYRCAEDDKGFFDFNDEDSLGHFYCKECERYSVVRMYELFDIVLDYNKNKGFKT